MNSVFIEIKTKKREWGFASLLGLVHVLKVHDQNCTQNILFPNIMFSYVQIVSLWSLIVYNNKFLTNLVEFQRMVGRRLTANLVNLG